MSNTSTYAISGGKEGKSRLNVLAQAMHVHTENLLQQLGVSQGLSFLDNGCGGGDVARMAANMVGANGRVTAIDFDATIIELAKQDAQQQQIDHICFETGNALEMGYSNAFDFAYARFLLSHLSNPLQALQKMKDAVKPNGKVVVEDIQFSGHFCFPENKAYNKYLLLYAETIKRKGGNAEIGPTLIDLFDKAGFHEIGFDMVQPVFATGNGKWMAYLTMEKIKESVVQESLATAKEVDELLQQLKVFTEAKNSIISLPRVFRVWGSK